VGVYSHAEGEEIKFDTDAALFRLKRPDASTSRLNHHQIACQPIGMYGIYLGDAIRFGCVRKSLELKHDYATCSQLVADQQLAEISIGRNENATLGFCNLQNFAIRNS
jgi:hypothetical protein